MNKQATTQSTQKAKTAGKGQHTYTYICTQNTRRQRNEQENNATNKHTLDVYMIKTHTQRTTNNNTQLGHTKQQQTTPIILNESRKHSHKKQNKT